jgi:hypothetical protein
MGMIAAHVHFDGESRVRGETPGQRGKLAEINVAIALSESVREKAVVPRDVCKCVHE